jgi:hypothetical protein
LLPAKKNLGFFKDLPSGATRLRSLPTEAGEGECNEAVPMRGSQGHGLRWRSGPVVGKIGGGSSSMRAWKKAGGSSGMRGRGAGVAGDGALPFIGAERHRGGSGRVVTASDHRGLPLMAGASKRGFKRGNQSGGVNDQGSILMLEARRRGLVGCSGN